MNIVTPFKYSSIIGFVEFGCRIVQNANCVLPRPSLWPACSLFLKTALRQTYNIIICCHFHQIKIMHRRYLPRYLKMTKYFITTTYFNVECACKINTRAFVSLTESVYVSVESDTRSHSFKPIYANQ